MRVLHVLDHSIPLHSGYTFRTLAILREQRKLGWQTFHVTSPKHLGATADFEIIDGMEFFRTLWQPTGVSRAPVLREHSLMTALERRIDGIVADVRPDIFHVHSPVLNALPTIRVARRLGVPVVYEIRAFWEDAAVDHGTTREGSLRYRATRAMETRAMYRADHVTTICEGLRSDIVARGIPAEKVTVIPNAVDVESFSPCGVPDEALRVKLGLSGAVVVGFIGSFYAYEGLDLLLSAVPRIAAQRPELRVLLVGGGPQDGLLRSQAQQLGIADRVVFTGRVPHHEVQRHYDLIDVLAYPRHSMRLTELVTPLKPLEAMAQGRLLVASDVGGHRELIEHGKTGMLFRAGDAESLAQTLLSLLETPDRWSQFRDEGRAFVERERNWCASVARYRQMFELLVARSKEGNRGD